MSLCTHVILQIVLRGQTALISPAQKEKKQSGHTRGTVSKANMHTCPLAKAQDTTKIQNLFKFHTSKTLLYTGQRSQSKPIERTLLHCVCACVRACKYWDLATAWKVNQSISIHQETCCMGRTAVHMLRGQCFKGFTYHVVLPGTMKVHNNLTYDAWQTFSVVNAHNFFFNAHIYNSKLKQDSIHHADWLTIIVFHTC